MRTSKGKTEKKLCIEKGVPRDTVCQIPHYQRKLTDKAIGVDKGPLFRLKHAKPKAGSTKEGKNQKVFRE